MDVSDRRMQVQLTSEAKIATDFFFIGAIFAFVDFVSALTPLARKAARGAVLNLFRKGKGCLYQCRHSASAG